MSLGPWEEGNMRSCVVEQGKVGIIGEEGITVIGETCLDLKEWQVLF